MAAVLYRRSLRKGRLRGRQDNGEENVTLDYSKAPADNLLEVLQNVVCHEGTSKAKRLGYFNAFVRLCYRYGAYFQCPLSKEQILCCLRVGLIHEAKEMRAACLRALRYFIQDEEGVEALVRLHIDYLIAKSLDICLDNDYERIHALRLIRKIMQVAPAKFPRSLITVMVSIANDGAHESDKMVKTCLATICELALHNPGIVAECGGIGSILHNVLDCHHFPRVNESLLATVLYLLNHPRTRHFVRENVDLEQMLAPFTDCHYRYSADSSEYTSGEDKKNRFSASKMAITTIIKSWPGMIRLCKPDGTGLQSLLGALCLPHLETRKEIMDILFDVFRLQVPDWTDDFTQALMSVDPAAPHESWRIVEGFVAEEGKALLTHLSKTRPNLVDNHLALILYAFINAQLLEALIEVIVRSDDKLSIRATILLGELLHMANTIIPYEISRHSHCLPTLIRLAANPSTNSEERECAKRAQIAVTCLSRHHDMKKRLPVPSSLFLDQILQRVAAATEETNRPQRVNRDKLLQCLDKESHSNLLGVAVHDSQVLTTKENTQWDWDLILAILKWPDDNLKNFNDQSVQKFVRRLLYFFKPTNRLYASFEQSREDSRRVTVAALHFVDFLLDCDEGGDATKAVEEWLTDIAVCLMEIRAQRAPHDALFQPSVLVHTLSQDYFLILGCFSSSIRGGKYLESTGVFQLLLDLVITTSHDTYIKLIVSSLDYSHDGMARIILSKALTATSESARLYASSFVRVLLRARVPFLCNWAMEMLVMQLYDQSKAVAMEALSVISEACEDEANLHTLIKIRPSVLHLGNKGAMLLARFLSIPAGFKFLSDANYIQHELEKWHKSFNVKYVQIVEERLNEAQTTYEKTYDGTYTRRSSKRQARKDVFLPVHLYGQLVQHKDGFKLLERQPYLADHFECIRANKTESEECLVNLKTALWAVGHMGTSVWGLSLLQDENIIPEIIKIAEESEVFSLRGTAFYILGLLASTRKGADILSEFGWESVRHTRSDMWPVVEERAVPESEPGDMMSSVSTLSLTSSARGSSMGIYQHDSSLGPSVSPVQTQGSSPKTSFFLEEEAGTKSRSSTGESGNLAGSKSRSDTAESSYDSSSPKVSSEGLSLERSSQRVKALSGEGISDNKGTRSESCPTVKESTTEDCEAHPRSRSDPLHTVSQKLDSHVVVHFQESQVNQTVSRKMQTSSDLLTPGQVHLRTSPTGELQERSASFRDERSESNESSRTSKSRSDSDNTDITTSGIGSYESGPHGASGDHAHLSPIPSASSMATSISKSIAFPEQDKHVVHPSDSMRRAANLRRVPSLQRRFSNPGLGPLSPVKTLGSKHTLSESMIVYANPHDTHGYATLREIQRQRTLSSEVDPKMSIGNVFDESHVPKTRSLDFRLGKPRESPLHDWHPLPPLQPSVGVKDRSFQSLQELELTAIGGSVETITLSPSRDQLKKKTLSVGRAEYVGICLPVDVNMIFHVNREKEEGAVPSPPEPELPPSVITDVRLKRSVSEVDTDTGLQCHTLQSCMGCYRLQRESSITIRIGHIDENREAEDTFVSPHATDTLTVTLPTSSGSMGASPTVILPVRGSSAKSRNSSMSEMNTVTNGSITSTNSIESSSRPFMSEDSDVGRMLIRKEVLRLIINMSSSVSVKSSEQGLLSLKQKFGRPFQDVCLYSEVCEMLANYNYRLTSRRFIQELFQDVGFESLFEEPSLILHVRSSSKKEPNGPTEPNLKLDRVPESSA